MEGEEREEEQGRWWRRGGWLIYLGGAGWQKVWVCLFTGPPGPNRATDRPPEVHIGAGGGATIILIACIHTIILEGGGRRVFWKHILACSPEITNLYGVIIDPTRPDRSTGMWTPAIAGILSICTQYTVRSTYILYWLLHTELYLIYTHWTPYGARRTFFERNGYHISISFHMEAGQPRAPELLSASAPMETASIAMATPRARGSNRKNRGADP
jgi:hypothetical protein